jgi:glutathione S-transferase
MRKRPGIARHFGPRRRAQERRRPSPLLTPRWQQRDAKVDHGELKDRELRMITLYGFGAGFGLPEISPFVTKTEVQLKMAGLAYRKVKARPPASPKGQLPFIDDEGERVADSTFIRAHIEGKYGFDFDAPLSLQARAQAWAFERMIEHHVYWALVGARWVDDTNFAKGPAHFFDGAPELARDKLREDAQFRVAENYLLSGLGRHAPDEDVDLAIRSLFALSVQLGDKPYLMGDAPCGTDATAFGALAGILTPFFDSQLRERTAQFTNLTAYVDRMMLQYYPEFAWVARQEAA